MPRGVYIKTEEHKTKISNSLIGFRHSEETKNKMRLHSFVRGKPRSNEIRNKISKTKIGVKRGPLSVEWKRKISSSNRGILKSEEHKRKIGYSNSLSLKGRIITDEWRNNLGLSRLRYMTKNNHFVFPNVGKYEKEILDKLQDIIGFSIKRGFYIDGYWLDGYCQELNLAIEVDENRHFDINGNLKEKDIFRQNRIVTLLGCKFIRIKESDYLKSNEIDISPEVLRYG